MTTTYTAITQEADASLTTLTANHYNLQVAKSVSSPKGAPSYNVVYKSAFLANNMSVAWSTTYGLNWVAEIPAPGAMVTYGGRWQQCSLGQSYDLNDSGQWIPNQSNTNADQNSLNVGSNGYQTAVHIIVGVQDPTTTKWTPVWVGEDMLLMKAHGEYMPRQSIKIWFEQGTKTATIITKQGTPAQEFDMTTTPVFYFSYEATPGKWLTPQAVPYF